MNQLFVATKQDLRKPTDECGYVALPDTKLARYRDVGDYSLEVGQHPATALASPLGRITPISER
jgi:hypothetical protein